jgi:cyclophilin family peptidyl-prolyl cis-trans isomerase
MTRRGWIVLAMGGLILAASVVCSTQNPTSQAQAQMASSQPGSTSGPASAPSAKVNPVVVIETSEGDMTTELWPDKAPKTVENFLRYVDEKHYDGTIFHRVIEGFMIQGGGYTPDMSEKTTHEPIQNESRADTPNEPGTLAMARTSDLNSATAQFFINVSSNGFLNSHSATMQGDGYAVFGKVISGMDVVKKIEKVGTSNKGLMKNAPVKPVIIKRIYRK